MTTMVHRVSRHSVEWYERTADLRSPFDDPEFHT